MRTVTARVAEVVMKVAEMMKVAARVAEVVRTVAEMMTVRVAVAEVEYWQCYFAGQNTLLQAEWFPHNQKNYRSSQPPKLR
jgi:hypothetical protein